MTTDIQQGPGAPQDQHRLEQTIIAQIINNYGTHPTASSQIRADMFNDQAHRAVFEAFMEMTVEGKEANLVTIRQHMIDRGTFKEIGMEHYLHLADGPGTAAHFQTHVRILTEFYARNTMITMGMVTMQLARQPGSPWDHVAKIQDQITELSQLEHNDQSHDSRQLFTQMILGERPPRHPATNLHKLEDITQGTTGGELCIIAGRPGAGKSTLINNIIDRYTDDHQRILICSLEMESIHVVARYAAYKTKISHRRIQAGNLTEDEYQKLQQINNTIHDQHILEQRQALTAVDIRAAAIRYNNDNPSNPIKAIIVDHGGLLKHTDPKADIVTEYGNRSRALKQAAMELGITVFLLWQLNRQSANSKTRPGLTDLRGSGRLEEDADQVIFIHRPEEYGIKTVNDPETLQEIDTENLVEFIVAKNRNGATGASWGIFDKPHFHFRDREIHDALPF